jgi:hypothetical protein
MHDTRIERVQYERLSILIDVLKRISITIASSCILFIPGHIFILCIYRMLGLCYVVTSIAGHASSRTYRQS